MMAKTKGGRPGVYSDELADKICARIAGGESLAKICKGKAMPCRQSVQNWRNDIPAFMEKYSRAREDGADYYADQLLEIARDVRDGSLDQQAGRVAADILKWTASKLKPKSYGERIEAHLTADSGLLAAMESLGNRGLPGDNARIIEGTATELVTETLPESEKAA